MSKASFLHISDLHLDTPFDSVSYLPSKLKDNLKNASFMAFKNAIDFAISSQCDAVLIAGDIYDGVRTSARAQVFFKECLESLSKAGLYSIIAHGNHDLSTDWALITEWPEKVIFLPEEGFAAISITSREGEEFDVLGSSGVFRDVNSLREGLSSTLEANRMNPNKYVVAVLHSDISGRSPDGGNYTSILPSDFARLPVNFWALGHIHQFSVVNENPHIVYSGTIQGRSLKPSECGEKGGVYVEVENSRLKELTFKKFASVEFNQISIKIDRQMSQGDLILEIRDQLKSMMTSEVTQILRLNLRTLPENRKGLNTISREEEFLNTAREVVFNDFGVAIESIKWEMIKSKDSPLSKEIVVHVENIISGDLLERDTILSEILKAESIFQGINTDLDVSEVISSARERINSLLNGEDER